MRSGFKRSQSGYSLIEMLVVVAIVGVLSLISVPAFMNFRRSADFKSGMRAFTTDLRNARAAAISNSFDVRVEIDKGSNTLKRYRFWSSRNGGTTWEALQLPGSHGATPSTAGNMKQFAFSVWVDSATGLPDYGAASGTTMNGANGLDDIVFKPSGAAVLAAGNATGTVVLRTDWKKIAYDKYTITISPSGQFTVAGSHT